MAVATVALAKPKLLLGEGKDEVRFFNALLAYLGISDIQVVDYGGKTRLKDYLEALAQTPISGFAGLVSGDHARRGHRSGRGIRQRQRGAGECGAGRAWLTRSARRCQSASRRVDSPRGKDGGDA